MGTITATTRTWLVQEPDLPSEFVRVNWTSQRAKDVWEPIFSDCSRFFQWLERESVRHKLRSVTIQSCAVNELDKLSDEYANHNMMVFPIDKVQASDSYQSSGSPVDMSKPWNYKVAIGSFEKVRELANAYKLGDNTKIGELLDYPPCCIEFFNKVWVQDKWIDTSYAMSRRTQDHTGISPYNNILLRWLGLRFISHLPCSFTCPLTKIVGEQYYQLATRLGARTQADILKNILLWPVEWSGLHGIAFISTPVCRITTRTDMLTDKQTVRLHSNHYPHEASYGLKFPFKQRCTDNGFSTVEGESKAHNLILDLLRTDPPESVIDLGCGNMSLLRKISYDFGSRTCGVDSEGRKDPDLVADIFNLDDFDTDYDIAMISRARVRENPEGWEKLRRIIERRCKRLLVYSYNHDMEPFPLDPFHPVCGITDQANLADLYDNSKRTKLRQSGGD